MRKDTVNNKQPLPAVQTANTSHTKDAKRNQARECRSKRLNAPEPSETSGQLVCLVPAREIGQASRNETSFCESNKETDSDKPTKVLSKYNECLLEGFSGICDNLHGLKRVPK